MTYEFGNIEHLQRKKEIEGETGTELGIEGTDSFFQVLAATDNNVRWRSVKGKVRAELRRMENARTDETVIREYMCGVYAERIVIGWRGVTDKEGNEIPFSKEACRAYLILADDAYNALEAVIYDHKNFRGARINAVVDNAKN